MKAITIALKDLLIAARDRNGLVMLLAMPFVTMAILGFSLGGLFKSDLPRVEPFEVGVVAEDTGGVAALFEQALADPAAQGLLLPVRLSEAEARQRTLEGTLAGAVVFPEGCSERAASGKPLGLTVLVDPGRSLQPDVIRIAAQTFSDRVFAAGLGAGAALIPVPVLAEEVARKGGQLSSFQYYAAAMAVMFLLFAGLAGVQSVGAERRQMTLMRVKASPGSAWSFATGKFLGVLFVGLVQFLILMVGMRVLFGVTWGSPLLCLAVAAGYAIAIAGLAVLVAAIMPEEKNASTVWSIATQVLAAFGGSMWPLSFFPVALQKVAAVLPNYWALRGLLGVMTGQGPAQLIPAICALVGIGLAGLWLGSARLAKA